MLKRYKAFLTECKQSEKYLVGDKWTLANLKALSIEGLWTWYNSNGIAFNGYAYLGLDKYVDLEKEICFELEKYMRRKHCSVLQDHLKYIQNDIVKPFSVVILCYA